MPPRTRLPAAVLALSWVSLCTDLSSEMIVPLLPAFVATMGAGPAFLGLLEGTANTVVSLLKWWAGTRSDGRRRKPWILGGYGLSSVARPLVALAGSPLAVLSVRVADRVGKGIRSAPRDALVAAVADPAARGAAFGRLRAMDHAGALGGALVAATLLALGVAHRSVFALAAIPAAVAMVVLWLGVREPACTATATAKAGDAATSTPVGTPATAPGYRAFLVVVALASLGHAIDLQLLLRCQQLGVAAELAPLLWALLHVVRSGLAAPLGALSDRVDRRTVIALGLGAQVLVLLLFAHATSAWQAWLLFAAHGLHAAFTEGAERGMIADLHPTGRGGRAFGMFHMVSGIAVLPLAAGFGWLWEEHGAPVAFHAAAGLAFAAAAVLLRFVPRRR